MHALSKKWFISKDQQQPAVNEPYRKPKENDGDDEDS
jgi:hypothetical protein